MSPEEEKKVITEMISYLEVYIQGDSGGCKTMDFEDFPGDPDISVDINAPSRCLNCSTTQVLKWLYALKELVDG